MRRFIRRPVDLAVRLSRALSRSHEEGQGLAEYSLILALVAMVCIAALTLLGGTLSGFFNQMAGAL